ncbi:MAG: site-specific integrase [Hyphomicrobium sp.]|nr:site-specific integrase [Hyphomicrobium sp.]
MDKLKLTKRVVDAAKPRGARYTLWDCEVHGLGLRVSPSGFKSWVVEYRPGEGGRRISKRKLTLGPLSKLTPDQARKAAHETLSKARLGSDPADEKSAARRAMSFEDLTKDFLSAHVALKRKPRTLEGYRFLLEHMAVPALGRLKAKDVKRADVARLHAKHSAKLYQANRMLAVISSVYTFAAKRGVVPEGFNPARGVEKFPEKSRERFLTVEELDRLGAAIREAEADGIAWEIDEASPTAKHVPCKMDRMTRIGPHAAAALRLYLLTGARLREILHLRWEEVDFERGMIFLPDSKTGRKPIILNAPALDIIAGLPKLGAYVIAGNDPSKPRADLHRPWKAVATRAGLGEVRIHDLRHTFASFGAGGGFGLPMIGKLLGHKQAATTQRYAHLDNDPLRRATGAIGASIAAAMGMQPSGEVISLNRARKVGR